MRQMNTAGGIHNDAEVRVTSAAPGIGESLHQKIVNGRWSYASILTGPSHEKLKENIASDAPSIFILADTEAIVMQAKIQRFLESGVRLSSRAYAIIFKEAFAVAVYFDTKLASPSKAGECDSIDYSGQARFLKKNQEGEYLYPYFVFPVIFYAYKPTSLGNMGNLYIPQHAPWKNLSH